ncbi:hypothetical protein [Streptomyces sp. NPDC053431]|uniref:hypothetical protein n=1 Tax=Streptomyces sp. NPDC053431 TaxID=3365703 RepID=UPI0037D8FCFA
MTTRGSSPMALTAVRSVPSGPFDRVTGRAPRHGAGAGPLGRVRRLRGRVLVGAGLALLPWLGYLAGTLPPAEAAGWVTLDTLEAAALLTAGTRVLRGDSRYRVPAAAAAVLLVADACVDLATASPGLEQAVAVAMAALAELPLAGLCVTLAVSGGRSR